MPRPLTRCGTNHSQARLARKPAGVGDDVQAGEARVEVPARGPMADAGVENDVKVDILESHVTILTKSRT
jgi:hypothetical protein